MERGLLPGAVGAGDLVEPDHSTRVLSALSAPADSCFDEAFEFAVEHFVGVSGFVAGSEVFHHLVGVQHVGADLVAPGCFDVVSELFLLGCLFCLLEEEQAGFEHAHGGCAVLDLRLFVLHGDHGAGGQVGDAYGGVGGVD